MEVDGPASSTPASSSSSSVTAGGDGTAQKPWLFVGLGNPDRMYNLMGLSAIDEERWMLEVLAANVSVLLGSALLIAINVYYGSGKEEFIAVCKMDV